MGAGILVDTNAATDYLRNLLPAAGTRAMDRYPHNISVMTRIELLGWSGATGEYEQRLASYVETVNVEPLTEPIVLETIRIRRTKRMKLPDAVIAATALVHHLPLYTRNTKDFHGIAGLTIIDPHTL